MIIYFLGTSSASVTHDRDNTSLLVTAGSDLLLFECGGYAAGKILRLGYNPNDLKAIFLTHLHIDHCYGLPALLFHMFLQKRSTDLDIFCPEEEIDLLEKQLQSHGIDNDVRTYAIRKRPILTGSSQPLYIGDHLSIFAGEARHSRPTRAFKVTEPQNDISMVYTGDTGPLDALAAFSKNTDLLIHESTYLETEADLAAEYGHSTAGQAAQIAAKANAKALALIHFEFSPESTVDDYRAEAKRYFDGRIYTPHDLSHITL